MEIAHLMGWGDEIMVSGIAKEMQESDPRPVAVLGKNGKPRFHEIWTANPRIAHPENLPANYQTLKNHSGCRPYVVTHSRERWVYTDWQVKTPGEIYLTDDERERPIAPRYVLIEPHVKNTASPNKAWLFERFEAVVLALRGMVAFVQPLYGRQILRGAFGVNVRDFRHSCGILSHAALYIGNEGGMHHAAAALGIPAIVHFGGMVSPRNTGYRDHVNLYFDSDRSPCGMRVKCDHCDRARRFITVDEVVTHAKRILDL